MSPEVFQNANVSLLACQLFIMLISLGVVIAFNKKAQQPRSVKNAVLPAVRL